MAQTTNVASTYWHLSSSCVGSNIWKDWNLEYVGEEVRFLYWMMLQSDTKLRELALEIMFAKPKCSYDTESVRSTCMNFLNWHSKDNMQGILTKPVWRSEKNLQSSRTMECSGIQRMNLKDCITKIVYWKCSLQLYCTVWSKCPFFLKWLYHTNFRRQNWTLLCTM